MLPFSRNFFGQTRVYSLALTILVAASASAPSVADETATPEAEGEKAAKFPPQDRPPADLYPNLVWADEFDGDSLDYGKWGIEVNSFGGGNQELQMYSDEPKNVRVEDGSLVLEAHRGKTNFAGTERDFSSGRIRTKHRGDWKYGRIEVRAKLPRGQGIWPAIWMLPTDKQYGGWASSGEIDIMEMRGQQPDIVLGTLHYGGTWPDNLYSGSEYKLPEGTFADDYHTFTVVWQKGRIDWFIDDVHYQTQTKWSSGGGEFPAPFDQRFHILLNLAVGGQFLGNPDETTEFPARMLVDYVRVYQ